MFYALGDLHLGSQVNKPMDVFGDCWANHTQQIEDNWKSCVSSEDVVLIPGDISWAMTLDEAEADLKWIQELPGTKVMIRGNHDYWWSGIGKVRSRLGKNAFAVQNDAIVIEGHTICGTRGWMLPTHPKFTSEDDTILHREIERLRLSLSTAKKLGEVIIAMMHYPPCSHLGEETPFTRLLEEYGVSTCVYGHLHGPSHRFAFEGSKNGVLYQLASADYLHFKPTKVLGTYAT